MNSFAKCILFNIIYAGKIKLPLRTSFRKGFFIAVEGRGKITIGNGCFFNNYCSIISRMSVRIGDGSIFGENVKIYDHNHNYKDVLIPIKDQGYNEAPVSIGKHCWICSNVVVLKGVTIGDNSVVGAGTIVTKDVPANSVVAGNPMVIIKKI